MFTKADIKVVKGVAIARDVAALLHLHPVLPLPYPGSGPAGLALIKESGV